MGRWWHKVKEFVIEIVIIQTHRKRLSNTKSNITSVMGDDEVQNICQPLMHTEEIIGRYDVCIKRMSGIIEEINKEYGKPENDH